LYVPLIAHLSTTKKRLKSFNEYGDGVVIDYDLNISNDRKSHCFYNVKSLKAFAEILDTPFAREWDKENNCKDIVYKFELI